MEMPEPLVEVTLEKPALIEEIQYPEAQSKAESSGDESSGGGMGGKLVALLVVAGIGMLAWKMKSSSSGGGGGGGGKQQSEEYEHGPEPEIGGDKKYEVKRKVTQKVTGALGIVVAVVGLTAAVLKRRG